MATAEFRGYVNRPETKEGQRPFSKFTLGVTQKTKAYGDKPESKYQYYVDCVDFKNASPPDDGAFVTVKGYLDINEYESKAGRNAGKTMMGLKLNVQELTVAEPLPGRASQASQPAAGTAPDPWANKSADGDEIPF